MTRSASVIVVGGGVIGLSIARQLAGERWKVTLFDRAECGREASWAGAGILSPCNPHRTDPVFQLQEHSLSFFPEFCDALQRETGIDCEYERCGELTLHFTEDSVSIAKSDVRAASGRTMPDGRPILEFLQPTEVHRLEPMISPTILGASLCRQTAQVRNPRLLRALYQCCVARGVEVHERSRVVDLVKEKERVCGVVLENGRMSADAVVLCAGAWSSRIGAALDSVMPIHPIRGQMVLLKLETSPFESILSQGRTYLVPRRDGHVLLGSTEEPEAGYEKRNTAKAIHTLIEQALTIASGLSEAPIVGTWSGLRPGTPDDKPYIGAVPGFGGLWSATGHYRSGLTLAPTTAEAITAMLSGRKYGIDLSDCAPGRNRK